MIPAEDQERLARIRADSAKWCALDPLAQLWDTAFLIRVIDAILEQNTKRLKRR